MAYQTNRGKTMSQPLVRADNPYSIFRLPEALTCWPAVSVMAASFPVAALVFALGGALARVWMGFTVLLALVAIVVGWPASAALAPACQTWRAPYRGLVGYFIAGLLCLPAAGRRAADDAGGAGPVPGPGRGVFICKIPVLGPLLLVVVVPVAVLAMAALMLALYVASSIVGPALWDGERDALAVDHPAHHPQVSVRRHRQDRGRHAAVGHLCLDAVRPHHLGLVHGGRLFAAVVGMGGDFGGGMAAWPRHGWRLQPAGRHDGRRLGHVMGAGVGFSLVFALASAFVSCCR